MLTLKKKCHKKIFVTRLGKEIYYNDEERKQIFEEGIDTFEYIESLAMRSSLQTEFWEIKC